MRKRSELTKAQVAAVAAIVAKKQIGLFMKPGSGKTAATLTALEDLGAYPALVVAPVRVAESVWRQEASLWEHTQDLQITLLRGPPKKRLELLARPAQIFVINYELLPWLAKAMKLDRFKAIVWDELSRMKSPGAVRFRAVRGKIETIPVRVGLTGTPRGNNLLNLWGELYVCAGDKPLGRTYGEFKRQYFDQAGPTPPRSFIWNLKSAYHERQVLERIRPWTRTILEDRAPASVRYNEIRVTLPPAAMKIYRKVERDFYAQIGGIDIFAQNALVKSGKIRQVASGAIHGEPTVQVHTAKVDALVDLVEEMEGTPLLVFFEYRHELERIQAAIPGARELRTQRDIDAWNAKLIPVLCVQPQSAAHGLNLQAGGSDMVWFTVPWSWELWSQGVGRLARKGQTAPVMVHSIVAADTIDERVVKQLREYASSEQQLLRATS